MKIRKAIILGVVMIVREWKDIFVMLKWFIL